jgi:hypothetical protein
VIKIKDITNRVRDEFDIIKNVREALFPAFKKTQQFKTAIELLKNGKI